MKISNGDTTVFFLLPTLRTSGGVQEALRLAKDIESTGPKVQVVSLWSHPTAGSTFDMEVEHLLPSMPSKRQAWKDLPQLAVRFWKYLRRRVEPGHGKRHVVFATHFSTLPFLLLVRRSKRFVYVQDLEWSFVAPEWKRQLLKRATLFFYRRASLLPANLYLKQQLEVMQLTPLEEAAIWASPAFSCAPRLEKREFDFVMVLRAGAHKRLDLYQDLLTRLSGQGAVKTACITPDEQIAAKISEVADHVLLRPSVQSMRELYSRTKVFVLLSEHEGFALPPLEAMGAGCVPFCRDCGGVSAYVQGPLSENLVPLSLGLEQIAAKACALILDQDRLERLSIQAHQKFLEGLQLSQEKRASSLAMLKRAFSAIDRR